MRQTQPTTPRGRPRPASRPRAREARPGAEERRAPSGIALRGPGERSNSAPAELPPRLGPPVEASGRAPRPAQTVVPRPSRRSCGRPHEQRRHARRSTGRIRSPPPAAAREDDDGSSEPVRRAARQAPHLRGSAAEPLPPIDAGARRTRARLHSHVNTSGPGPASQRRGAAAARASVRIAGHNATADLMSTRARLDPSVAGRERWRACIQQTQDTCRS